MRTLLLLRHAKSSWDDPSLTDHERPLARRGTHDATRMGAYLRDHALAPDVVLCSGAVRTRATLALVLTALDTGAVEVQHDDTLYLAEPAALLKRLGRVTDDARCVMIVGHNPGLHALALALVGSGATDGIKALARKYPTGALAVIDFDADRWAALEPGRGALRLFVTPRTLS